MDLVCIDHVLVWFHCLRGLRRVDTGAGAHKITCDVDDGLYLAYFVLL